MPEPLRNASAKLFGRRNFILIPAIASVTLAPTVAEATGASAFDVTRVLFANNTDEPTMNTDAAAAERRWGDTDSYEFVGETKYTGGMMAYAVDPQAASGSTGKKLYEFLPAGWTGFLFDRMNIPRATALAVGQFGKAIPIEVGPTWIGPQGDGVSAEASGRCRFAITGPPSQLVAVLA